jgi:hypothetical protein
MNLLTKLFEEITFEDVVESCKQGTNESARLDYKGVIPNDLSKHFATFSNTYGGIIIVGVEEDPKTGKPNKYDGITLDSKGIDRIHQFAANVSPFPRYEVRDTNEVGGKVFILIKIYQGENPPYMSNSDSSIKVRTGNVTTPLKSVDSHELNRLYDRRERATSLRLVTLESSEALFLTALERTTGEVNEYSMYVPPVSLTQLEEANLRISILPFSPSEPIMDYRWAFDRVSDYRIVNTGVGTFPGMELAAAPGGIYSFRNGSNGKFDYGFVNENGLIDSIENITRLDQSDKLSVSVAVIVDRVIRQLQVARKLYKMASFNGLLSCVIRFENADGLIPYPIITPGHHYWPDDDLVIISPTHTWKIPLLDTATLNDDAALVPKIIAVAKRIYWGFGFSEDAESDIIAHLSKNGFNTDTLHS